MERITNEILQNTINTYRTLIYVFEHNDMTDADHDPSLDKCILSLLEELKEYRGLEEQGLLLRLPCKVGDTVYILSGRFGTFYEEDVCDGFYIGRDGILQVKVQNNKGNHGTYGVIGETIFLTKEEAEAALEEMNNAD